MTVLWQGDKRWSKVKLGEGGATIGKAGCLLTSYAQAVRQLGIDADATPLTVQALGLAFAERAFRGPLVVHDVLGRAIGLKVADRVDTRDGAEKVRAAVEAALVTGGLALLHVDHDEDRGGDYDADHWVLAVGLRLSEGDEVVVYADPATAEEDTMPLRTLSCPTNWAGVPRIYQVRAVRALHRLPSPV